MEIAFNPATHGVFEGLGDTLCLWVDRLYKRLQADKIDQVFFLSREGQPLRRMFDVYARRAGGGVTSRYLEVSRRATLLPSLGPVDSEQFETLFRQYRTISLFEFLSSLGLDEEVSTLSRALGLKVEETTLRQQDFPTSHLFARLRDCDEFRVLYEKRRIAQRSAFIDYLRELAGGVLPKSLVVVDVGWKGTIQDNLHAMLCKGDEPQIDEIRGYYVGLIAPGNSSRTNTKEGLLFSCIGGKSSGFHVFNENKSLFEIVLAADHGSVIGYTHDPDGKAQAICGPFDEGDMLERSVFPILQDVEQRFRSVLVEWPKDPMPVLVARIEKLHARMVFRPTHAEIEWFDSIFHVENFGLFERSYFSTAARLPTLLERVRFLLRLIQRRNVGELGFWPWATLYRRGGWLPARAYAAVRQWQARRGVHA